MTAAIDIGLKRIGLSLLINNVILPQEAIIRKNRNQASNEVKSFLHEWNISTLVVGFPDDEDTKKRILHFVNLLNFDKKIVYIDENLTSKEAKEMTKGQFRQKKDGKIDSIAASLILQRYINQKN